MMRRRSLFFILFIASCEILAMAAPATLDIPNRAQVFVNTEAINATLQHQLVGTPLIFDRKTAGTYWSHFDEALTLDNSTCDQLELDPFALELELSELTLTQIPHESAFKITLDIARIAALGHLVVSGCLPFTLDDDFTASIENTSVIAAVSPQILDGTLTMKLVGKPSIKLGKIKVDFEKVWNGLEAVLNTVISLLSRSVLHVIEGRLVLKVAESLVGISLPVATHLEDKNPFGFGEGGVAYTFDASIDAIRPLNTGIAVDADFLVSLDLAPSDCAIDPSVPPRHNKSNFPTRASIDNASSHLALSIPDGLVNDVLYEFWRSGQLCITKTKVDPIFQSHLNVILRDLADLLKINLVLYSPPLLRFGTSKYDGIVIELREVDLVLDFQPALTERELYELGIKRLRLKGDFDLYTSLRIDKAHNVLKVAVDHVEVVELTLEHNGEQLTGSSGFSPSELTDYLIHHILPMIGEKIAEAPLFPPTIFPVTDGFFLALDEVVPRGSYLNVFLSLLWAGDPAVDNFAPNTEILGFVDDFGLSCIDLDPSFSSSTQEDAPVFIDGEAEPQTATVQPSNIPPAARHLCTSSIRFEVAGSDERNSPLLYEYLVLQCSRSGQSPSEDVLTVDCTRTIDLEDLKNSGDLSWQTSAEQEIMLSSLSPGEDYLFLVRAKDSNHNVDETPSSVMFSMDEAQSSGCSMHPIPGSSGRSTALLGFILVVWYIWRRVRQRA